MLQRITHALQHRLSRFAAYLASRQWGKLTTWGIQCYIRYYHIDMTIAEQPLPSAYASFNDFFTRALKSSVRPIDSHVNSLISPVDGTLLQLNAIESSTIIIKNQSYPLEELLCSDVLAKKYQDAFILQAYLSPKDYHRIHMPFAGTLKSCVFIPGALSSVNPNKKLGCGYITKNRRMIAEFENHLGDFVFIMVGALNVGDIQTAWGDSFDHSPKLQNTISQAITLNKGEPLGQFLLGSAIVMLTRAKVVATHKDIESSLKWGERLLTLEQ